MNMNNEFDDELSRMDELEKESESPINKALSLDDPISELKLRAHPIVQTGTKLQSVINTLRDQKVGCVMVESNPETLQVDDPIAYALNKMHVFGIRHIPMLGSDNKILGLVSVKDVIAHIGNYYADQIVNLPSQPDRKALDRPEGG
jgi:CBS domain-containing protein